MGLTTPVAGIADGADNPAWAPYGPANSSWIKRAAAVFALPLVAELCRPIEYVFSMIALLAVQAGALYVSLSQGACEKHR